MTEKSRLKNFPISFFSVMLGLLGFTIANMKAVEILDLNYDISSFLTWFSLGVFLLLLIVFLLKLIFYTKEVTKDFNHPIKINFFPTIGISFLMFSIVFLGKDLTLAKIFWLAGVIIQTTLTFLIVTKWMHQSIFKLQHFNPSWFIPAVGNIIVPLAGVQLFDPEISWFYFSIGFILWLVLLTISFYRLFFHEKLSDKLTPTLFLLIAPQAVGFIAYVKLTGSIDLLARILYYFTLFIALLLLTQIKHFIKLKYYLSWWAYSFPISAFTISTMLMFHKTGYKIFSYLAYFGFTVLNLIIIILIFQTLKYIFKKEICIEE